MYSMHYVTHRCPASASHTADSPSLVAGLELLPGRGCFSWRGSSSATGSAHAASGGGAQSPAACARSTSVALLVGTPRRRPSSATGAALAQARRTRPRARRRRPCSGCPPPHRSRCGRGAQTLGTDARPSCSDPMQQAHIIIRDVSQRERTEGGKGAPTAVGRCRAPQLH